MPALTPRLTGHPSSLSPLFRLLALLALLAALLPAAEPRALAQSFELNGLQGERLTAADLDRGVTLVVVWASWSPRSRNLAARVNPLAEQFHGRARVVTVNFQEERATVENFLTGKPLSVPVFLDPDGLFSKTHSITTLPGLLIVKDGRTVYHGKLPEDPDRVILDAIG